jgi:hypothetical protein
MRLVINKTKYPTLELEVLAQFASKGMHSNDIVIKVTKAKRQFSGKCYFGWFSFPEDLDFEKQKIVVKKGYVQCKATQDKKRVLRVSLDTLERLQRYLPITLNRHRVPPFTYTTWQEVFVCVVAHEVKHHQDCQNNKHSTEFSATYHERKNS